jgi:hypothetical protein
MEFIHARLLVASSFHSASRHDPDGYFMSCTADKIETRSVILVHKPTFGYVCFRPLTTFIDVSCYEVISGSSICKKIYALKTMRKY